ncbi:MAG: DUF3108 domain-containing protein [Pseudolabrys sp.]|nr:DUF3108 domain-containing protein [Pseudolabrys sp.]
MCAASAGLVLAGAAAAETRLDARYVATLAGLPIGEGTWLITVDEADYSATATGTTTGLMRAFTGGRGQTVTRGTLQAGKPVLSSYTASIHSYKKTDEISLKVDAGTVRDLKLDPPAETEAERVPITEAVKQGVLDPMTATLIRMPGKGDVMTPEACARTLPVFDGRLRYDLRLSYKRTDEVKADKGYAGPAVVCAVQFSPVAGYIPTRAAIKYLTEQRDMEIWLVPIAGTRVLVPFRAEGPTPIGRAILQATEFVTTAGPARINEPVKASIKPRDRAAKAAATEAKTP